MNWQRMELQSPMFMCTRDAFSSFAKGKSRLLMGDFYKQQRRSLGVLIDDDGQPTGGRWSFDADNRKKLPRNVYAARINLGGTHAARRRRH